jgi:hypothetical protein
MHSWSSASRPMLPASVFRYPASQSGTGAFRYRTRFVYSGAGLLTVSVFYSLRCLTDRMPYSPAFRHLKNIAWRWRRIQPERLYFWWWKGIHPHVQTLLVGGNGYTLTSANTLTSRPTLLLVERDTPWCTHAAGGGKGYTLTFTPC